jgi:hypothetical protein
LDLRRRKWQGAGENYIMRSTIICTLHQILVKRMRWVEKVIMHDNRNAHKILIETSDGKGQLVET